MSAASLDDHRRCARRTYYRFVAKAHVEQPETLPMAIGKVMHAALKEFFASPVERRALSDLHGHLRATWRRSHKMRRLFSDIEEERHVGLGLLDMLTSFHERGNLAAAPIALEQTVKLPFSRRVAILGRVDRIDACADGIEIIDYKTGRPFDDEELPDETSLMVYAAAARLQYARPVTRVRVVNLRDATEAQWDLEDEDIDASRDRLGEMLLAMHRDRDWHATPGPACRACRWAPICDQGADRRALMQVEQPR